MQCTRECSKKEENYAGFKVGKKVRVRRYDSDIVVGNKKDRLSQSSFKSVKVNIESR